jgi:hypothetical protein
MYATLLFDTEDFITPSSDDDAKDLAEIMTRHGLRASFIVVGEKARVLERRGRRDVIAALGRHDIGLHTDLHSRHPTIAEFLEDKGWADGVDEAERRERPGVEAIQRVFGRMPSSWGIPGSSWGPQLNNALRRLDIPASVYPLTYTTTSPVHRYAGTLTYGTSGLIGGGFDFHYPDDDIFERELQTLCRQIDEHVAGGTQWVGIFVCHPTTMRSTEFWDAVNFANGHNPDPRDYRPPHLRSEEEYQAGLRNFERLMRFIAGHPALEVRTFPELQSIFGYAAAPLTRDGLREVATRIVDGEGIITEDSRVSPAEAIEQLGAALLQLARGDEVRPRAPEHVDGPVDAPLDQESAVDVAWPAFLQGVEAMLKHIARTRGLPAAPSIPGDGQVGLGGFYRGLAAAYLAADRGQQPATISCPVCPGLPALAAPIAEELHQALPAWPIHRRDLDDSRILEHTRRQTWTLRPAIARS